VVVRSAPLGRRRIRIRRRRRIRPGRRIRFPPPTTNGADDAEHEQQRDETAQDAETDALPVGAERDVRRRGRPDRHARRTRQLEIDLHLTARDAGGDRHVDAGGAGGEGLDLGDGGDVEAWIGGVAVQRDAHGPRQVVAHPHRQGSGGGDQLHRLGPLDRDRLEGRLHLLRPVCDRRRELLVIEAHGDGAQQTGALRRQQQFRHVEDRREGAQLLLAGEHAGQRPGPGGVGLAGQGRGCRGQGRERRQAHRGGCEGAEHLSQRGRRTRLGAVQPDEHLGRLLCGEEQVRGGAGGLALDVWRPGEFDGRGEAGGRGGVRDEHARSADGGVRACTGVQRGRGKDGRRRCSEIGLEGGQLVIGEVGTRPEDAGFGPEDRGQGAAVGQFGLPRCGDGRLGCRAGRALREVGGIQQRGVIQRSEQLRESGVGLHRRIGIGELQGEDVVGESLEAIQPGRRGLRRTRSEQPDRGGDGRVDGEDRVRPGDGVELPGQGAVGSGERGELIGTEQRSVCRRSGDRDEHAHSTGGRGGDDGDAAAAEIVRFRAVEGGAGDAGAQRVHARGRDAEVCGIHDDAELRGVAGGDLRGRFGRNGGEGAGCGSHVEPGVDGAAVGEGGAVDLEADRSRAERAVGVVGDGDRAHQRAVRGDRGACAGGDGDADARFRGIRCGVLGLGRCRRGAAEGDGADDEQRGEPAQQPSRARAGAVAGGDRSHSRGRRARHPGTVDAPDSRRRDAGNPEGA